MVEYTVTYWNKDGQMGTRSADVSSISDLRERLIEGGFLKKYVIIKIRTKSKVVGTLHLVGFRLGKEPSNSVPIVSHKGNTYYYAMYRPKSKDSSNLFFVHPYTGECDKLAVPLDIKDKRIDSIVLSKPSVKKESVKKERDVHPFGL